MKTWRLKLWVVVCLGGSGIGCLAQTNVWTNSAGGSWEQPYWSAGILPGTNQTILFTNDEQTLTIGGATVLTHPETLHVDGVLIDAPNSFNELLLDGAGTQNPLMIGAGYRLGVFIVGSNSAVEMHSSALQVNNAIMMPASEYGAFSVGGTFNQGDFSQVTARFLHVGNIGPATYNFTNGLINIGLEYVGGNFDFPSVFNQYGGTNLTSLEVTNRGLYNFYDGFVGNDVTCWGGDFKQFGGNLSNALHLVVGSYTLAGGTFVNAGLTIPESRGSDASGVFVQTAGTNISGGISLSGHTAEPFSLHGSYTLANGVLLSSGSVSLSSICSFSQFDGVQTNSGISLLGDTSLQGPDPSSFTLTGGALTTSSINVTRGSFSQSGGTNLVTLYINIYGGGGAVGPTQYPISVYNLSGGYLFDPATTVNSTAYGGGFFQSGGVHIISNLLYIVADSIPNQRGYVLSGGQLSVQDIAIQGPAGFHHLGGAITMSGTLKLSGSLWDEQTDGQSLGPLLLGSVSGFSNSIISFPAGSSVLNFAGSSGLVWSNQASLSISNWHGSLSGGGSTQIIFGNDASGLTPQQLGEIVFQNPAGEQGTYPATILSTGEIVPDQFLMSHRSGGGLVLEWSPGMTLQTATNVTGPYENMAGTSPLTVSTTDPKRFYRARR